MEDCLGRFNQQQKTKPNVAMYSVCLKIHHLFILTFVNNIRKRGRHKHNIKHASLPAKKLPITVLISVAFIWNISTMLYPVR